VTREQAILGASLRRALSGAGAHAGTATVFSGLDWKLAGIRPGRAPHSVWELLNHMVYWQEWVVGWLEGHPARLPARAKGSWPGARGPASRQEWTRAVRRFRRGLTATTRWSRAADLYAKGRGKSRLDMLETIAVHNSYHAGQVVVLRQLLDAWPPPSGGLTW
jgi:uncharacterized damage-inducible protein DinB